MCDTYADAGCRAWYLNPEAPGFSVTENENVALRESDDTSQLPVSQASVEALLLSKILRVSLPSQSTG